MNFLQHRLTFVALALLVTSVLISLTSLGSANGNQWAKYSGNPIMRPTLGGWDADYVAQPRVLYDNSTNTFRMWYVGSSQKITGIGYSTSKDGFTWTKHTGPVLVPGPQGAWDSAYVGLGSIFWNGTRFTMWYQGAGLTTFQDGAVGLATSSDGISWVKYSGNPVLKPSSIDQRLLTTPFVLKIALYNMWYAARSVTDPASSSVLSIIYASSLDGLSWSKLTPASLVPSSDPGAWDSASVYSPSVFYDESMLAFGMWYSALSQGSLVPSIGYATSHDGVSWTKSPGNPMLTSGGPGSWDSRGVANPDIVLSNNRYSLYYDGIGENVGPMIGLAQAPQGFQVPEFPMQTAGLLVAVLALTTICLKVRYGNRTT